jgi:hypothetical protein
MTFQLHPEQDPSQIQERTLQLAPKVEPDCEQQDKPILCPHCLRTATNGLKCKGICVSDSDY